MKDRRLGPRLARSPHPQLRRIHEATGWKTQVQMCRELDKLTSQKTVTQKVKSGEPLDDDWLWQIGYRFGVRFEWLKFGELPKERPGYLDQLPEPLRTVVELLREQPEQYESITHCAHVFASGHSEAIQRLARAAMVCDAWINMDKGLTDLITDLWRRLDGSPPTANDLGG